MTIETTAKCIRDFSSSAINTNLMLSFKKGREYPMSIIIENNAEIWMIWSGANYILGTKEYFEEVNKINDFHEFEPIAMNDM